MLRLGRTSWSSFPMLAPLPIGGWRKGGTGRAGLQDGPHRRETNPVLRLHPPQIGDPSPWGAIRTATPLGPDAVVVKTDDHGGIWISPGALGRLPAALRQTPTSKDGWYEDETDWCIPYLALNLRAYEPDPGSAGGLANLARTLLARSYPDLVVVIERLHPEDDDGPASSPCPPFAR